MSTFNIDFFELAFLAEACIPPRPIARMSFWQDLTRIYWEQMTEGERVHLFEWLNKNPWYPESLEKEEETKIFHARFNPDNQYMVTTLYEDKEDIRRAFKIGDRFYTGLNTFISEEYIIEANNFTPEK
jgi:hypothetical protein